MIPPIRKEVAFVYVGDTRRRRLTKNGAYLATAYAAIEARLAEVGCHCLPDQPEYHSTTHVYVGNSGGIACIYHDYETRERLAKRLARWLKWRDSVRPGARGPLPTSTKARVKRMAELQAMRSWCEAEMVRLDVELER